jgi:DNA polymerase III delta prime subunit
LKTQIVLLSGKQGSGKTTLAAALRSDLQCSRTAFEEVRFAQAIYAIHDFRRDHLRSLGITVPDKDGEFLQDAGTKHGRQKFGEDVWVRATRGAVKRAQALHSQSPNQPSRLVVVISDCRFRNEFEAFPDALRVRLECARDVRKQRCDAWRDTEAHLSEMDLDDYVFKGRFDMVFNTLTQTTRHCSTMIQAQLDKNVWLEKREVEGDY